MLRPLGAQLTQLFVLEPTLPLPWDSWWRYCWIRDEASARNARGWVAGGGGSSKQSPNNSDVTSRVCRARLCRRSTIACETNKQRHSSPRRSLLKLSTRSWNGKFAEFRNDTRSRTSCQSMMHDSSRQSGGPRISSASSRWSNTNFAESYGRDLVVLCIRVPLLDLGVKSKNTIPLARFSDTSQLF